MEPARLHLIVSVDDDHLDKVGDVAKALAAAGFQVDQVLEAAGSITGSAAAADVARLEGVPGVAHVEREREVRPLSGR